MMLCATAAQPSPDTLRVDLKTVLQETVAVSPDIRAALSNVGRATARYELAQSSRILPDATVVSAMAVVPGIENPNGTPLEELYLDPAVRNDYGNLRPYAQAEVSFVQPIYTWGALRGAVEAASAGADLEEARAQETILGASLRAAELYYNVLLTNELQRLVDRAGDVVAMAMEEINRLLEEGDPEVDDADRYEVLITQQEYEQRIVEVNQARQTAHAALRRQLMLADSTRIVPVHDALEPLTFVLESLDFYQQNALRHRPEILQAEAGMAATGCIDSRSESGLLSAKCVWIDAECQRRLKPIPATQSVYHRWIPAHECANRLWTAPEIELQTDPGTGCTGGGTS